MVWEAVAALQEESEETQNPPNLGVADYFQIPRQLFSQTVNHSDSLEAEGTGGTKATCGVDR